MLSQILHLAQHAYDPPGIVNTGLPDPRSQNCYTAIRAVYGHVSAGSCRERPVGAAQNNSATHQSAGNLG